MENSAVNDGSMVFNEYLSSREPHFRQCLTEMRTIIKSVMPDAEETFSYQAHCFKYIYMLVGIGTNKEFCSLYTMSPPLIKQTKAEAAGCKLSGAIIHLRRHAPRPAEPIIKTVNLRKGQNE